MTLDPTRFLESSLQMKHFFTKKVLVQIKQVRKTPKSSQEKEEEVVAARSYTTQSGGQGDTTQLRSKYFHKQGSRGTTKLNPRPAPVF